jgi:hypothetical protein
MKLVFTGLFIAIMLCSAAMAQSKGSNIEGVWRLDELTVDGKTQKISQPSMFFFTKKHYSIIYVSSDAPRPISPDITKATADELRTIFVDSFVANAGAYDISKDGKISFWPKVAKSPLYMKDGNYNTSTFKITGNTMTMTTESANNYPVKSPMTSKLTRIE